MKKPKEFDFEKSYVEYMKRAKENGLEGDMIFETLMKEFRRLKKMCDELYKGIEEAGVSYVEVGSTGQETFKANPLNKDYLNANKALTNVCDKIGNFLDSIPTSTKDDWL